jgi:hypothetical protein
VRGLGALFLSVIVVACSSDSATSEIAAPPDPGQSTAGAKCTSLGDCASGLDCRQDFPSSHSICSNDCTSNADCTGGTTCSALPSQPGRACLSPCTSGNTAWGLVCDSGVFNRCSETQTPACSVCGCPDQTAPVCDSLSGTCGPLRELGSQCAHGDDCVSGRCGRSGCELLSGSSCAGNEQYCGGQCTSGVCLYMCEDQCDSNSKCFSNGLTADYCALRCSNAGEPCPVGQFGGAWTCKRLDNGNPEDLGPWCVKP